MEKSVALVTGGSSGIGLETVNVLAQQGYRMIATIRDHSKEGHLVERAKKGGVDQQIEVLSAWFNWSQRFY